MTVRTNSDFWYSVQEGDKFRFVKSESEIAVDSVFAIIEWNGKRELRLFESKSQDGDSLWLVANFFLDGSVELKLFAYPSDFRPGTREIILADERQWLYQEPQNVDNFEASELEYASEFEILGDDGNPVLYRLVEEVHGEWLNTASIDAPEFVILVEYKSQAPCSKPDVFVVEIGGYDMAEDEEHDEEELAKSGTEASFQGGIIHYLEGRVISPHEIEYFPVFENNEFED